MKVLKKPSVKIIVIIMAVFILTLLVLFSCGVLPGGNAEHPDRSLTRSNDTVSVHFITPDGDTVKSEVKGSKVSLDPPEEIANYTFIGWRDQQGNMEKRESINVFQDIYYSAVYAVALQTENHMAYLFSNQYGMYSPYEEMRRADVAIMLHTLLAVPVFGSDSFIDVPKNAACYEAVAALKELGVISGSRFHPDEGITRAELLEMLSAFYPAGRENYEFADLDNSDSRYPIFCTAAERGWIESGDNVKADPDHIMTRVETAKLMNFILGRMPDEKAQVKQIGPMIDMKKGDSGYWDMAEACVSHEYELNEGAERWTGSTPIEKKAEGLYLFGLDLYAVGHDGHLVKSGDWNGFAFDENGLYTSGNPDLDQLIRPILAQILDPSMEREEMLHTVYRYTVDSFTYLRRNFYFYHDTSWAVDEAYTMLSTRKGNCYNFAGAFCMLARALGYDAAVCSGFIGIDSSPHAWVEITIDGEIFVFDPEIEYSYKRDFKSADMYMLTLEEAGKWTYTR